jgi:phosphatidate cytidylyltransferase
LLTAAVGIPLIIALVGWGPAWLFAVVIVVLVLATLREYFVMALPEFSKEQWIGTFFGLALTLWLVLPRNDRADLLFGVWLLMLFSAYLLLPGERDDKMSRLLWTILGTLYVGYLFPHWALLFSMPGGRAWVFFVLLVVLTGDSAGYLIGRRYGRRKLAPELSPGKTIEGALGYLGGSLLAGTAAKFFLPQIPMTEIIVLSAALSVLGQIGDLFESWLKRVFAVKDSGTLLPGHGGLLDRLDSLIFPGVFTTAYLKAFHA